MELVPEEGKGRARRRASKVEILKHPFVHQTGIPFRCSVVVGGNGGHEGVPPKSNENSDEGP